MTELNYVQKRMTLIFDEWNRREQENPDLFISALDENGKPRLDYGRDCALYFEQLAKEMDEKGLLPTAEEEELKVRDENNIDTSSSCCGGGGCCS